MAESATLKELTKELEQSNLILVLKGDKPIEGPIRATGPNEKYPLPWYMEKFPGCELASIISTGGEVEATVVSMINPALAMRVLIEVNNDGYDTKEIY